MRVSLLSITGLLIFSLLAAPASAKIYPYDFQLTPDQAESMQEPTPDEPDTFFEDTDAEVTPPAPFFYVAPLKDGVLTRAEFIEAIATRLYDAAAHDDCFKMLVSTDTVNFDLLHRDVTITDPRASSVCIGMRAGLARGGKDGRYNPNVPISAAEAAIILARVGLPWYWLGEGNDPWYGPSMRALRAADREFTLNPWDNVTGRQLKHIICVMEKRDTPLDPLDEFNDC